MRRSIALAAFACLPGIAGAAETLVTLTMTERAGVERRGEYITFGVPLPKGAVRDAGGMGLLLQRRAIEAEIIPVTRWWDDGSLRWVHLIFRADCPAGGSRSIALVRTRGMPRVGKGIRIEDGAERILVETGPLRFTVRKKGFQGIARASFAGREIVRPHGRGLGVVVEGREYLAGLDPGTRVAVEETGPLHAVIRAEGSFRDAEGGRKFDFIARIHAHAGSPVVRLVVTLLNRQGGFDFAIPLEAYFLELPTAIRGGRCLFGSEEGTKTDRLAPDEEAFIYQSGSDRHVFGGVLEGEGRGKSTKSTAIGWGALADGEKGLACGVRWFWQLHPKSIEVGGDGRLRVGLYPARHGRPLPIYAGVARTHEILLVFGARTGPGGVFGEDDAGALRGRFAGLQWPLRPFAPPRWYCRDTRCLGDLCEAGGEDLYGRFAGAVRAVDEAFDEAFRRCEAFRDRRVLKGVETDSYGFLGYGDGVHWVWTRGIAEPENIAWDGNYYGFPHMMCVQFLRTGRVAYFDAFEAHALHVADVHTVHYAGKRTQLVGGCRYCPPTDHVRIDPRDPGDYRTARVYISNLFNHHKVAGVIDRWYFLRDHRAKEVADEVLDYCHRWTYGDDDYGQPRGPGMILVFCADAYDLYGDRAKWVARASNVLRVHRGRDLNLSFQAGIFLEGMRRFHAMSGDEEALAYMKRACDRIIAQGGRPGGNTCAAMSYLYRRTRDPRYLEAALAKLPRRGRFGNPWKDFALFMRNAALCIGDLHHIAREEGGE